MSKGKAKVRKQDKQYTAQYNSGLVGTRDLISIMLNVFTNIIYQIYMKTKTNKNKENKGEKCHSRAQEDLAEVAKALKVRLVQTVAGGCREPQLLRFFGNARQQHVVRVRRE